ncbi:hypothetical protein EDB92DRAFT_1818857 [Lactarius akahatsu]|uniref:Uncharacterized protein n=1 Tax=Lactarius akahatsu TaxID=416441 RepID=A0AAD4LE11_9AGAM|nr:hypothetical protein EDB92DRAFT_1818857 [Lactarius akahatsu]
MAFSKRWTQWAYYYACHEARCSFWLDVYDANHMISDIFWVTSPAHVGGSQISSPGPSSFPLIWYAEHRLEALYWTHWFLFPAVFDGRCFQSAVHNELIGILSYGCIDVTISESSTLPYDGDTMQQMIELVRKAKASDTGVVYYTAKRQDIYEKCRNYRIFIGLEPVAIITIFNLPWALLMSTRIFVAVASAMLAALIGWCVQWSSSGKGRWFCNPLLSLTLKCTIDRPAASRTVAASKTPHRGEGGRGRQHEGEFVQRMDELDFVMRSLQGAIDVGYSPSESIVE